MPDQGRWTSNGGDPSLNDINRVDRFIEALSANQPVYSTDPAEAELAFLMADWRDGVRETPVSAVVTERDAAMALDAARAPRRPNRLSLAVIVGTLVITTVASLAKTGLPDKADRVR